MPRVLRLCLCLGVCWAALGDGLSPRARPARAAMRVAEAVSATPLSPAAAPRGAQVQIPPEIPVRRAREQGAEGWGALRGVVVALTLLAIALAVLVRRRRTGGKGARPAPGAGWLGRLGLGPSTGEVRLLQSVRLTPRATVHVLRWGREELLLGCADAGVSVLERRPAPAAEPPERQRAGPVTGAGGAEP